MKFDKYIPAQQLRPYVRQLVITEAACSNQYKVLPTPGLVIGFQYKGRLAIVDGPVTNKLAPAGVTGITDTFRIFSNSANTGTVLVYFTETGFANFTVVPAHELFNRSIALTEIFRRADIEQVEDALSNAITDKQRILIIEQFLVSKLNNVKKDLLIEEAVRLIIQRKGATRISQLNKQLLISQSPFEKRFRKIVGSSPKKFASIVRLNAVIEQLTDPGRLTGISYENNFFDQAHFIKDFKQFTGSTPENFRRFL
jgi:AraC-like DNA-binding protein